MYHQYPSGNDVLGLVADNDVAVFHPVNSSGVNQAGSLTNPTIDAAILSLNHSFYVQNWSGQRARPASCTTFDLSSTA